MEGLELELRSETTVEGRGYLKGSTKKSNPCALLRELAFGYLPTVIRKFPQSTMSGHSSTSKGRDI